MLIIGDSSPSLVTTETLPASIARLQLLAKQLRTRVTDDGTVLGNMGLLRDVAEMREILDRLEKLSACPFELRGAAAPGNREPPWRPCTLARGHGGDCK